jgi:hypothetical protein
VTRTKNAKGIFPSVELATDPVGGAGVQKNSNAQIVHACDITDPHHKKNWIKKVKGKRKN